MCLERASSAKIHEFSPGGANFMALLPWGKRHEAAKRAEELLAECCQRLELGEKTLGKSGLDWISRRKWDDDTSEMRRIVYYAALTSKGPSVDAAHFPPIRRRDLEAFTKTQFENLSIEEAIRHKLSHFFERLGKVEASGIHDAVISQVERPLIEQCLKWAGGSQQKAARSLGMNRNTLHKKMKTLGIKLK